MAPSTRVLWVEDAARYSLRFLASPVVMTPGLELVIAEDPTEAVRKLLETPPFDIVIVDIRLPPGTDPDWIRLHRLTDDKLSARLGRHLMYTIIGRHEAEVKRGLRFDPARIGVLSIETEYEISDDLKKLGITAYAQKTAASRRDILLELIQKILTQKPSESTDPGPKS